MNIGLQIKKNDSSNHKFIQSSNKPLNGMITEVSLLVTNQYLHKNLSAKIWRKEKKTWNVNYEFPPGQKLISFPINYILISESIRNHGYFDYKKFNLPELSCMWLDHSTDMKLDFHMHDNSGTLGIASGDLQAHYYGNNYPIHPTLKREGHLYTSFQPQLIKRIISEREKLIQNSDKSLTDDWVFDLRNLISDTISLIDIAFTQFYIKAEYDPLPGWKFDKNKLGVRHGRRLNDKFKWIFQITGKELNIESEVKSLDNLRILRNHLMHFDPPSLVITLEEATIWLNQIIDIGKILVKFRKAINVDISIDLINFLLQKEAIFKPYSIGKRQPLSLDLKEDYYSSVWPL